MEKVTKEVLRDFILNNEIELLSTHTKLCVPIINRIYRKMSYGINFSAINVDDKIICDHHRYLASLLSKYPIQRIPAFKTTATTIVPWELVAFEDEEWDKPHEIILLNERDANYNNISIERIVEMLKQSVNL